MKKRTFTQSPLGGALQCKKKVTKLILYYHFEWYRNVNRLKGKANDL